MSMLGGAAHGCWLPARHPVRRPHSPCSWAPSCQAPLLCVPSFSEPRCRADSTRHPAQLGRGCAAQGAGVRAPAPCRSPCPARPTCTMGAHMPTLRNCGRRQGGRGRGAVSSAALRMGQQAGAPQSGSATAAAALAITSSMWVARGAAPARIRRTCGSGALLG
jgi:hypothetical protein